MTEPFAPPYNVNKAPEDMTMTDEATREERQEPNQRVKDVRLANNMVKACTQTSTLVLTIAQALAAARAEERKTAAAKVRSHSMTSVWDRIADAIENGE